jgi:hypothetical protein
MKLNIPTEILNYCIGYLTIDDRIKSKIIRKINIPLDLKLVFHKVKTIFDREMHKNYIIIKIKDTNKQLRLIYTCYNSTSFFDEKNEFEYVCEFSK